MLACITRFICTRLASSRSTARILLSLPFISYHIARHRFALSLSSSAASSHPLSLGANHLISPRHVSFRLTLAHLGLSFFAPLHSTSFCFLSTRFSSRFSSLHLASTRFILSNLAPSPAVSHYLASPRVISLYRTIPYYIFHLTLSYFSLAHFMSMFFFFTLPHPGLLFQFVVLYCSRH